MAPSYLFHANREGRLFMTVPGVTPVTEFARRAVYTVRIGLRIGCGGGFGERSSNVYCGAFPDARHGPQHLVQPDLAPWTRMLGAGAEA
jgi:hypothetical protein